jgi:hypothetical protein
MNISIISENNSIEYKLNPEWLSKRFTDMKVKIEPGVVG